MKLATRAYLSLMKDMPAPSEVIDKAELLQGLQGWIQGNIGLLGHDMAATWGLDHLAELNLALYPVPHSELDPEAKLRQFRAVPLGSMDTLAMFLRDILWEGIALVSDVACPQCESLLRFLKSGEAGLVLSCDQCSWSQTPDGRRWRGPTRLQPATTEELRAWGVLR